MKVKTDGHGPRVIRIAFTLLAVVIFSATTGAQSRQEDLRKSQQGLIAGADVSVEDRERFGLLTINNSCSAALLRNNWAITAAHCLDSPDPNNAGAFITVAEDSVTLTANWVNVQSRKSARIISFRPMDVALIRVDSPFTVAGSTRAYNRDIHRGALKPVLLTAYGRGIFRFAQMSGGTAVPSQRDGNYRVGFFTTDEETDEGGDKLVWYPSAGGQMIAGGDSGGPSFVDVAEGQFLFGVHARCKSTCLAGQACTPNSWMWVASTPRCADAPVAPIWDEIDRYLGAFVPEPLPDGVRPGPRVKGGVPRPPRPPRPICDSARMARARNSPAAPGLEGQCLALINAFAAKGEGIANRNPRTAELRRQYAGPALRGFDTGMGAAEGQTAPGPGKQSIHDFLSGDEQRGFSDAVSFSLALNRYAERVAKGAEIAKKDPVVAEARNAAGVNYFYWLGFDIATAIFGDPALGAQGNTVMGPGAKGILDSLDNRSARRGFDDAMKLHLSRNYKP